MPNWDVKYRVHKPLIVDGHEVAAGDYSGVYFTERKDMNSAGGLKPASHELEVPSVAGRLDVTKEVQSGDIEEIG